MPTLSHTLGKGLGMSITNKSYSVRVWDSFYNTWVMIPETGLTRDEAIKRAIELSDEYDSGENGTQEVQVWIDCLSLNTAQMVGYVAWDYLDDSLDFEEGWVFHPSCC